MSTALLSSRSVTSPESFVSHFTSNFLRCCVSSSICLFLSRFLLRFLLTFSVPFLEVLTVPAASSLPVTQSLLASFSFSVYWSCSQQQPTIKNFDLEELQICGFLAKTPKYCGRWSFSTTSAIVDLACCSISEKCPSAKPRSATSLSKPLKIKRFLSTSGISHERPSDISFQISFTSLAS